MLTDDAKPNRCPKEISIDDTLYPFEEQKFEAQTDKH